VSSLDDDFVWMDLKSGNFDEEGTDDKMDSQAWSAIKPESDAESMDM